MLKTLSLILIPILLVLVLNSFYNQEREALAHEYETMCETIIPIGHAIDETQETAKQIIDNLEIILKESEKQINQAERMINFANQCDRNKCSTGCHKYTYRCNPYPCNCREVCEIDLRQVKKFAGKYVTLVGKLAMPVMFVPALVMLAIFPELPALKTKLKKAMIK